MRWVAALPRPCRILRAGDVTLNVEKREVWRGERRIELSERECALLKVLMREPGRAFSRMELSERVWERAHEYDTKLIEIYIGRLRKKIDEGATQPLIKTVRHLGLCCARRQFSMRHYSLRWKLVTWAALFAFSASVICLWTTWILVRAQELRRSTDVYNRCTRAVSRHRKFSGY
jgi:Response regulators consisting of a CheY-like receiver domain and a winged-helix DNA-binding domain